MFFPLSPLKDPNPLEIGPWPMEARAVRFQRGLSPAARGEGRESITSLGRTFWWPRLWFGVAGGGGSVAEQSRQSRKLDSGELRPARSGPTASV